MPDSKKTFFISTSIPYVNAAPHVGFAMEAVQADIIARFHRLMGEDVFFLSGTDDNALKNVQAAEAVGKDVSSYVAENAQKFEELGQALSISTDDFIKTSSDPRHPTGAQKLWSSCRAEDIYKKKYKGFYCLGCEEFKTEKELVNGECPEHPGKKLEEVEEENYFFKLSNYQEKLEKLIESDSIKVVPEIRKRETLAFIKGGLEDFSISRSKERARGWGVPVPGDESQIMYVWFDALSNYINALGYGEGSEQFEKFWTKGDERVHTIGKGINRFHTIYWPAMLLSAGVEIPSTVFIHGYITSGGQKMSKTLGNVIDPNALIKEYGPDATRYFLARKIPTFEDGDFTMELAKEWYNADLANGLGNLTSRVLTMAVSYDAFPEKMEREENPTYPFLNAFEISRALDIVWERIKNLDLLIQGEEPFKKFKTDPEGARGVVRQLVFNLRVIADMLTPFLPETAGKIIKAVEERQVPRVLFLRKD